LFTGLVQTVGQIKQIEQTDDGAKITVATDLTAGSAVGDSVAVSGVCLTVTELSSEGFSADVINESLRRTNLGVLSKGSTVNLELALKADGRLGGHFVQGHVDGVAELKELIDDGDSRELTFTASADLTKYVVEKGSITINGVSLTVSAVTEDSFQVCLIPETLDQTDLGTLSVNALVNIEVDILAKYVEKLSSN